MLRGRRSAGRRSPNCSTRSTSLPIRAASSRISPASSRSVSGSDISSNCAAPLIPASGFRISCASIAAMPVTERTAERWLRERSIRSARPCGWRRRRTSPGLSSRGTACMLCGWRGVVPQAIPVSYCATGTPACRACATRRRTIESAPRNRASGLPVICRSETPAAASAAGFAVRITPLSAITKAG